MRISKELLEKYHLGKCSEEERHRVEEWLFNDSFDEPLDLPATEDKAVHRQQIWEGIRSVLPDHAGRPEKRRQKVLWLQAAAIVLLTILGWFLWQMRNPALMIIEASNLSELHNKTINSGLYTMALGPGSNVRIDPTSETMAFCGSLSFSPTEDITMKIVGECLSGAAPQAVIALKGGASYIAFSYHGPAEKTEFVVVEQNQLRTLPPLIQKQLIAQFKI